MECREQGREWRARAGEGSRRRGKEERRGGPGWSESETECVRQFT